MGHVTVDAARSEPGERRVTALTLRFLSVARETLAWILVLGFVLHEGLAMFVRSRHAPETAAWLLAAFGVAGVLCHRRPRWLGTATLAFMVLVPTPRQYFDHELSAQLFEELEAEGKVLYRCLEAFRDRTGRWPETFDEAGCTPEPNPFGGWRIEPTVDDGCCVRVGEYRKDGFTLYRDPVYGWYLDA
jgi:hypothetical protein